MKSLVKYLLFSILLLLAILFGVYWGTRGTFFQTQKTESSQVMLERVAKVFKLVTVEASVSEIYSYQDYKRWDISPLRKAALVRVTARVSIGYDFADLKFTVDEGKREIGLMGLPEPEILSIDHDIDYYDIQEGLFNSFSSQDLTALSARAKEFARTMVEKSDVYKQADEQKQEVIKLIEAVFKSSGWNFRISEGRTPLEN